MFEKKTEIFQKKIVYFSFTRLCWLKKKFLKISVFLESDIIRVKDFLKISVFLENDIIRVKYAMVLLP
jgi:hypothetical protein